MYSLLLIITIVVTVSYLLTFIHQGENYFFLTALCISYHRSYIITVSQTCVESEIMSVVFRCSR